MRPDTLRDSTGGRWKRGHLRYPGIPPPAGVAAGIVLLAALAVSSPGGPGNGWARPEAERIVRFLSDDARGGRGSFTEGNAEAARFIAAEFGSAGLLPMDSGDSFIRSFPVTRVTPETLSVVLNGHPVPPGDCFILTEDAGGAWTLSDSFPARRMGDAFDRELIRKGSGLVLIPRLHERPFLRFRRFASGPRVVGDPPRSGAVVAVLTDSADARSCEVRFRARVDRPELGNVVGVIPGKRGGEMIMVSAHYDHLGIVSPVGGDSVANGADDNASGTTALVLLARRLVAAGRPERTILFAALAAEEIGGFGARRLLGELTPDSIVAMVNLEMVGKESKFGPRTYWITGYEKSTLGPIISSTLEGTDFRAHPDPYPRERLFFRSDNATFARAGVPAHTISTTPIDVDSLYHTVEDEYDRIDPGHIAEIVEGVALGLRTLVSGERTPSRIPVD